MDHRNLHLVPAEQRVDRVRFSGGAEWSDHVVHVGAYKCPHCGAEVEFNTGSLRKAETFDGSPLGSDWHSQCQVVRPLGAWEWPLDFKCRGRNRPVRIVFAAGQEFSMGSHEHILVQVIEEGSPSNDTTAA